MPAPVLFGGLFLAGAANQLGPKAAAIAVEKGSEVNSPVTEGNRTPEAVLKAQRLMDSMQQNARAIQLLKKQGF